MSIWSHCTARRRGQPGKTRLVSVVVALLLMTLSLKVNADPLRLLFLISKPSADYVAVMDTVRRGLEKTLPGQFKVSVEFVSRQNDSDLQPESNDLIVTIGTAAADTAYRQIANSQDLSLPILSVLITESSFSALAKRYFGSDEGAFVRHISSVFIDQPVDRSIRLAKLLLPAAKKTSVMLGPSSAGQQARIAKIIDKTGMESEFVSIGASDNPIHKIEPALSRSDVFIPVPDSRLINLATAKWILHLSYRHKVPVITFSRTYLRAGALAAVFSSPDNVAKQTLELVSQIILSPEHQGRAYEPEYYSIHFNYSVAASLKVPLREEQFYRQRLDGE